MMKKKNKKQKIPEKIRALRMVREPLRVILESQVEEYSNTTPIAEKKR